MRVVPEFQARFGTDPAVVGSAPGRVNLIGEHLDYNGGRSMPIALTSRTYAAASRRDDGMLVVESLQLGERVEIEIAHLEERVSGWGAYVAGVVWATGLSGSGYSILMDSEVPIGAGLSSSAALECAVAIAVDELAGATSSRTELAAACVRAENDYVGASTGSMDQTVAMSAEADHALLLDFAAGTSRQIPWHPPGTLLVIDTRAQHALAGGEYAERRDRCDAAALELGVEHLARADVEQVDLLTDPVTRRRARHVVSEQARIVAAEAALVGEDWTELGRLMTASHVSLRDDYEVSCPELDVAVAAAIGVGALGARMTGGGFGGSAIALVPPGLDDAVREAVLSAYTLQGWAPPRFVDGAAGGPADVNRVGA
jgi:galactokinase